MLQKAKKFVQTYWPYIYELQDVRVAGLVAFGVIVVLISWSGVKAIDTNYRLQRQISKLQQQNQVSKLDNANTSLQNEYYRTDQYLELSARQNLGLAQPGETELIVPENVALKYTVDPPAGKSVAAVTASKQPKYQRNLQAWVNFFLHRSQAEI
jgi:cell division protein FtsB